ncbi:vesicle-trafficking protein SEC22a isoform X1 [Cryptotermes secundus]|uniref:vesicle-trafficking protein SEC22a isoform X1 n=2 Tax=Cryptotermes secundus TaxID=105785 RepID=UPI000CD7CF61|nr:vesicle-trafficking protein SEC22a isoform X1 [Cryptotermes secundus]
MIVYALIVRAADGMALSATTDFNDEVNRNIKESKRYVKLLAKKAYQFPDRCTLKLNTHTVHFITALGLTYFAMCEATYPSVLVFSFLNEIMKEFVTKYELAKVNLIRRPYSFIEFDSVIHKTRQRYNKPQSLTTKINLTDLSTEIKLRPPYLVQLSQVEPVINGYQLSINLAKLSVGPPTKLEPLAWHGIIAAVFSVLLALVGFYRGLSVLSELHLQEYDGPNAAHAYVFLCEGVLRYFQVYLLLRHSRYRTLESWVVLVILCLCTVLLWELRDNWQVAAYVGSAVAMHISTLVRRLESRLPNYNV